MGSSPSIERLVRAIKGWVSISALVCVAAAAGCMVETLHVPERTGGEQAALANAIERACERLQLDSMGKGTVRIDVTALAPEAAGYVTGVLRMRLVEQGARVIDDPTQIPAEKELHVIVSEAGHETRTRLLQIPFPVALVGLPIGLTIWQRQAEKGTVRLRGYVVERGSNRIVARLDSAAGEAVTTETRVFGVVGPFRREDPPPQRHWSSQEEE